MEPILATDLDAPPVDPHWQPPRLGIIHFLMWPLAAVVFLNIELASNALQTSAIVHHWAYRGLMATHGALSAAGVVGLAVILRSWLYRRLRGRLQPGHWILIASVPATLFIQTAWLLLMVWIGQPYGETFGRGISLLYVLASMYSATILMLALASTPDGWCWRGFFAWLILTGLLGSFSNAALQIFRLSHYSTLYTCVQWFSGPLTLVAVIVVAAIDLRRRRDWLHWLGVAFVGGHAGLGLVWQVVIPILARRQ
jgi:hypothetical protein